MKRKPTRRDVFVYEISRAVNFWIHDQGDGINRYYSMLDREMNIADVVQQAMDKAADVCILHENELDP
jgi:hypothetical protein